MKNEKSYFFLIDSLGTISRFMRPQKIRTILTILPRTDSEQIRDNFLHKYFYCQIFLTAQTFKQEYGLAGQPQVTYPHVFFLRDIFISKAIVIVGVILISQVIFGGVVFLFKVIFIFEVVFYQRWLKYHLAAPDVLQTALKPMATLKTSLEANYDGRTGGQSDLQGHELPLCPKRTTHGRTNLVTSSLLELLIAARNIPANS